MNGIDKLAEAIRTDKSTQPYDTRAEVVRVSGSTAYVHIPGGVAETPVTMTIACKKGDTVQVRVSGGRAWIVGNETAPPTDDAKVKEVEAQTAQIRKRVTGLQGQYTEIQRTADNISTIVSDGDQLVSVINQSAGEVLIQAEKINLDGYTKITEGELGGFVTSKADDNSCRNKTSAQGGHRFGTSLYSHISDGTYEYEVGLRGQTSTSAYSDAAMYIRQITAGDIWDNSTLNFYVRNDGKLYAKNAEFENTLRMTNGSMVAQMTGSELQFTDTRSAFSNYLHKISGIAISSWNGNKYAQMSGGVISCVSSNGNAYSNMYDNCVEVGYSDGTYNRFGRLVASAAGLLGLYDAANANYVIYSDTAFNVHVPHQFLCCGADESSTTQRVPVGSSNVADQGVQWLGGTGANTLAINAEWNSGSFETKTIAVSSSDIRLKDNVTDTDVNALEFINRVKLHAFDWKWTHQHQDIGVIADELEQLDPSLVVGGGTDKEGNPIYKGINNLVLISYLTKAVQELSAKVEELEHKLSAMEDKNHGHS